MLMILATNQTSGTVRVGALWRVFMQQSIFARCTTLFLDMLRSCLYSVGTDLNNK